MGELGILPKSRIFSTLLFAAARIYPTDTANGPLDSLSCSTLILEIRNHVDSPGSALRQAKGQPTGRPSRNQKLGTRLYCFLRQHLRNFFQQIINTSAGID